MSRTLFITILLLVTTCHAAINAQIRETATWSFVSLSKPINSRWNVSAQTELRTGDDNTRLYLWYLDGNARYKINDWLSASVGFDYIKIHARATAARAAFWRTDWRPYIAINPSWTMGSLKASFNQSWTYNWMPETSVKGVKVNGKAFHLWRHRLTLERPIAQSRYTPFARLEVRHTDELERVRTTLGTQLKLTPKTSLEVGYIYQDMHKSTKTHALSLGYKIKL